MVRCGLPLMSKAQLGGTPIPRGLTALGGVSSPPPMTTMVTPRPPSSHNAGGETPPHIGSTHGPHFAHMSPRGEAPTLAPPPGLTLSL